MLLKIAAVPERRRRLLRQLAGRWSPSRSSPARPSPSATPRYYRYCVCRRRAHVPDRALARARQGRAGVGGHPPERGHGAVGRRATRRSTSCGRSRWPRSWPASPAACSPRRPAASTSTSSRSRTRSRSSPSCSMGGVFNLWGAVVGALCSCACCPRSSTTGASSTELLHDPVRHRRPPGAADRAGRHRGAGPAGLRQPRQEAVRSGTGRSRPKADAPWPHRSRAERRGSGADVVIEVDGLTVRFGGVMPLDQMTITFSGGHLRAHRSQRRRQDDVLQRPQRLRPADRRRRACVRRRPARDGRLPPGALGRAPHVPDRAGDREPVGLRERAARPRAHEGRALQPPPGRERRRSNSSGLGDVDAQRRSARSAPRQRRLVEVARAVVGTPRLVLLDEPAAGLPEEETAATRRRHPPHPGRDRRARDPRRPRHEPRVGAVARRLRCSTSVG